MWHAAALSLATRGCRGRHLLAFKSFPPCRRLWGGDRETKGCWRGLDRQPEGAQGEEGKWG